MEVIYAVALSRILTFVSFNSAVSSYTEDKPPDNKVDEALADYDDGFIVPVPSFYMLIL